MSHSIARALLPALLLFGCSSSPPSVCANDCTQGAVSCTGGYLSTCQNVSGCLEYVQTSTCPSGSCQDQVSCANPPDCSSFTTCDTCVAPSIVPCFWCAASNSCVLTPGAGCNNPIGGDNNAPTLCAQSVSCAPCALVPTAVCPDVTFECTCGSGQVPTDKNCTLQENQEYCCSS